MERRATVDKFVMVSKHSLGRVLVVPCSIGAPLIPLRLAAILKTSGPLLK